MKRIILTYGIIAGLIVAAMLVFTFSNSTLDFKQSELLGYTTMILAFSTIFFAIKSHQDRTSNGNIKFWDAFKIGLAITGVATFIYIIAWMIISNTIAKDFMADYFQQSLEQLKTSGLSAEEMATKVAEIESFREMYKNPLIKIGMTFLEIFPVGFVISLISALIHLALNRKS